MSTATQSTLSGRSRLNEVMSAAWLGHAVSALAELGVADLLDTPRPVGEVAEDTGCDAGALLRFLRAGCVAGVLAEPEPGRFALTDAGWLLRGDVPGSMRDMCRVTAREEFGRAWAYAAHTARTGASAFTEAYGEPLFSYLARQENQELAAVFHSAMAGSVGSAALLDQYDFTGVSRVVDVGGGRGAMLAAVLDRYPHLRGTLVDLPAAVAGADDLLRRAGVADRADVVPGSFFDPLPDHGDVYVLARVLANWNDEDSVRILRRVRAAMRPGARLVIVSHVPGSTDRTHYAQALDLYMFVLLQAKLRTEQEYRQLLAAADLTLTRCVPHPDAQSLVEAVPARQGRRE
jgi:SAM-dependent methyltransferase